MSQAKVLDWSLTIYALGTMDDMSPMFGEMYKDIQSMRRIYCDGNDHLIRKNYVDSFKVLLLDLEQEAVYLRSNCSRFDGKTNMKANGYRSALKVTEKWISECFQEGHEIVSRIKDIRTLKRYLKHWIHVLLGLLSLLKISRTMIVPSYNERHFPDIPESPDVTSKEIRKLIEKLLQLDTTPFYGDLSSCHLMGGLFYFWVSAHYCYGWIF